MLVTAVSKTVNGSSVD